MLNLHGWAKTASFEHSVSEHPHDIHITACKSLLVSSPGWPGTEDSDQAHADCSSLCELLKIEAALKSSREYPGSLLIFLRYVKGARWGLACVVWKRMFRDWCLFVEVGSASDTAYNLVHPKRKRKAEQEEFFELWGCKMFFEVVRCAEHTFCGSRKIYCWATRKKTSLLDFGQTTQTKSMIPCSLFLIITSELQK